MGKIGSGGFANVHHVTNRLDGKDYALKIVTIRPAQSKEDPEEYLYKLLSEAKTLANLNHPNVVSYHGCWL